MDRACSTNREKRKAYKVLMGNLKGKRPLGRTRLMWVDNIKMELSGVYWIDLAQDRDPWAAVKAVMNLRGSIKCLEIFE
jgi:hypothetical protein